MRRFTRAHTVVVAAAVLTAVGSVSALGALIGTAPAGAQGNGSIQVVSGSGQSATVETAFATPLEVQVLDQNGNPVAGDSVTFTAPSSGPSATFASATTTDTVVTDDNGDATDTATANTVAGSYDVTVSDADEGATAELSLTNTAGAAATVTATGGASQSATVATTFAAAVQATVTDQYGNPVPGETVTLAAPTSGASGTFTGTGTTSESLVSNAAGQVSDTFTANTVAGSYTVTASDPNVATPADFSLANTAGAAATVAATGGASQSATVATTFASALQATVADQYGNPVPGATVTLSAPTSGASGTFTGTGTTSESLVTNASGVVSGTFKANTVAGSYTVTATSTGATPASFSLANTVGAVSGVATAAGTPQSAVVDTAFATDLQVKVTDSYGNPIAGVKVTWFPPSTLGQPSGTFASTPQATTNASGIATAPTLTADGTTGNFTVTASAAGSSKVVSFKLTNVAAPPTITKVKPTSTKVGKSITITGTNFANATVYFTASSGTVEAQTWTVVSSTEIKVTVPTGAVTGVVKVVTPGGTATGPTVTIKTKK